MSLEALISLLLKLSILAIVFSLGFNTSVKELLYLRHHRGLRNRSLLTTVVLVPALAVVLVKLLSPSVEVAAALVLIAISPGVPLLPQQSQKRGGSLPYTYSLLVTQAAFATFTVPLSLMVLSGLFPADVRIAPGPVLEQLLLIQFLPLALGMAVGALRPRWADALGPPLNRVANAILVAVFVLILVVNVRNFAAVSLDGWVTMVLLALGALALGHVMGGPGPETRGVLSMMSALRFPGLALLIVKLNAPGTALLPPLLLYILIALVLSGLYNLWSRSHTSRRRPLPRTAEAT